MIEQRKLSNWLGGICKDLKLQNLDGTNPLLIGLKSFFWFLNKNLHVAIHKRQLNWVQLKTFR